MEETDYASTSTVALRLLKDPALVGKVFLEGGLVPWVVTGNDSGRMHGDVDLSVRAEDMPLIREWLCARGLYEPDLDSRNIACNVAEDEFGMHAVVDGILVSFVPFALVDGTFEQRNAQIMRLDGYDALLVAKATGLEVDDYVEMRELSDGSVVGMSTLEAVRASKVSTDREKDRQDLAEIDRIGYDGERYARVLGAFATMTVTCPAHSD